MKNFSEQRGQSDACIGYAESRGDWAKPMNNEDVKRKVYLPLVVCDLN